MLLTQAQKQKKGDANFDERKIIHIEGEKKIHERKELILVVNLGNSSKLSYLCPIEITIIIRKQFSCRVPTKSCIQRASKSAVKCSTTKTSKPLKKDTLFKEQTQIQSYCNRRYTQTTTPSFHHVRLQKAKSMSLSSHF